MQQSNISNINDQISPAEYARRRGLNRSTISRQIARGIIPAHKGLVDPKEADRARQKNLHLSRGRNTLRQREQATPETGMDPDPCRAMLDRIRDTAAIRLPELAHRLRLPEHIALAAADIFDSLLSLADADLDLDDYDWPVPTTEPPKGSKALGQRTEAFCTRLDVASEEVFIPAVLADRERYPEYIKWAREETAKKQRAATGGK